MFASLLLEHGEDVFLAQDDVFLSVELDLRARVLAEEDAVALLHLDGAHGPVVEDAAAADGDHARLLGLLLGGVGDDDPPLGLLRLFDALHEDAVVQGTKLHGLSYVVAGPHARPAGGQVSTRARLSSARGTP